MSIEECIDLLRALAVTFEGTTECHCPRLHTPDNPRTATGHVDGCPVDEAVRLDLARGGIV
jgi:hypothetical protein